MSRKIFTEEEVAILRQNPYVVAVSPKRIHYSPEFKQLFWKEYNETGNPSSIMRKYGFDPKILGFPRIRQMQIDIKQEIAKGATCYADIRKNEKPVKTDGKSKVNRTPELKLLKENQKLREENEYLKEKLAFLKKLFQSGQGQNRRCDYGQTVGHLPSNSFRTPTLSHLQGKRTV